MLTTNLLYKIFRDIVANYPQQVSAGGHLLLCKQAQTFAVIQSQDNINANNLLKDSLYINSPFFWARFWNENTMQNPSEVAYTYPLVCIAEEQSEFHPSDNTQTTYFNFFILDKMPSKPCEGMTLCDSRVVEEIFEDLQTIWLVILESMQDFVFATFDIGADSYSGWYPNAFLDNTPSITNLAKGGTIANYFDSSQTISLEPVSNVFAGKLAGFGGKIQFTFDACASRIQNYSLDNLLQTPDKGCC